MNELVVIKPQKESGCLFKNFGELCPDFNLDKRLVCIFCFLLGRKSAGQR